VGIDLAENTMSLCLKTAWVGGVIAALLVTTTSAAPPIFKEQNRNYGNSVYASSCNEIANGTICRDVSVWEIYDVKGTYEFTEAWLSSYRSQYNPEDGSSSFGYRYLTCPVGKKAITATPNSATLEAVLDPGAFGCE